MTNLFFTHILPGVAYLLLAYLAEDLLSIPPSDASAVWPAAGVSIAAILLRGYRVCFGLGVALMIFYASNWLDTTSGWTLLRSITLMSLLSSAALLEAAFAAWLVHRFLGGVPTLIDDKHITLFLLIIGPLASVFSSLLANITLLVFGVIGSEHFFVSWLTWFVGDSIGAIVIAPVLLALFANRESSLHSRKWTIVLPMAGLLLAVTVLFTITKQYELQERRLKFTQQAEQLHSNIEGRLEGGREVLFSLRSLFLSNNYIDKEGFSRFALHILQRYPELQALEWTPRILKAERSHYERSFDAPINILERSENDTLIPAGDRDFYYPISYIEPFAENERAFAFDIASNPLALTAVERARKLGGSAATAPIRLIQESATQWGVVEYLYVEHSGLENGLSGEGVVAAVYRMGDFIASVLQDRARQAVLMEIELFDITDGSVQIYPSGSSSPVAAEQLTWSREYLMGGRVYLFKYSATPAFLHHFTQWSSSIILLGGMLFTALLGGWLLSLTGTTLRIGQQVKEKTASLQYEVEERRRTEQQLLKVSKAVEFSPNMVLITLPDGEIEYSSPRFTEETGFSLEDVVGQNINMLYFEQPGAISYRDIWPDLSHQPNWGGEIGNRKKHNVLYWAQVNIAPIYDLNGELTNYVVTLLDVTENRLISEQMSYHASHDQLTGLINRREFEMRLQSVFQHQRTPGCQHSFCFLDLDQFKVVNDTCGHVAGDELLRQIASILQSQVRANDTLARLGGDEFGILLLDCPLNKAQAVAENVRDSIAAFKFCWEQQSFNIGVSVGVVAINEHSANLTEVLKQADSACYTAKDAGRNRVHLYTQGNEMLAQREGEMHWVSEINAALEEDRFMLYGQLIVPLQNEHLKPDIEILLRMIDREGHVIPPGAFLPAAERYQLAGRIDEWVVSHAFAWLNKNFAQFSQSFGCCAINLSGGSLGDPCIKEAIISHLESSTLLPYKVKFEITETAAIANLVEAQRFINALKAYGCQFSLDDFGSGLSSFAYLKNLPVDNLKVDGMFVKGILDDELDQAMVKSINDIGHVMHKTTIAEFVENDEICEMIRAIGVDYGQGYGLGLPEPLDKLLQQVCDEYESKRI
ncbi:EAL domain-containing protein [Amphritea sp. 1_MG-2023]|uniref:EAL domain-containing protein n=1 Tax=Amphritea sp. 1_MG-2023 TaxID=3062670 RepID=UPI0026E1E64B|nr:EAL domain-containing protein [Amphritea sp. 1_MG-2023]MDO6565038.1 EAL domain-containing protein [Amphritea sp. 1_MG-2023]